MDGYSKVKFFEENKEVLKKYFNKVRILKFGCYSCECLYNIETDCFTYTYIADKTLMGGECLYDKVAWHNISNEDVKKVKLYISLKNIVKVEK